MATTSPDNLRTPDPGDPYNLVADLATFANDVQSALTLRGNAYKGTASARTAFVSTATDGVLWQDTDGIKMIWRKDGAAWVPAVWRWSGTTSQMNSLTAPAGFEWNNTSFGATFVSTGSGWKVSMFRTFLTPTISGGGTIHGWYYAPDTTYTFPSGLFATTPRVALSTQGSGFIVTQTQSVSTTTLVYGVARLAAEPAANTRVLVQAWEA